jgi:hypothetical protein
MEGLMETKDTSGFYWSQDGKRAFAPNAVIAPTYTLRREDRLTYTYPAHGWYWFDSKAEADAFFGPEVVS